MAESGGSSSDTIRGRIGKWFRDRLETPQTESLSSEELLSLSNEYKERAEATMQKGALTATVGLLVANMGEGNVVTSVIGGAVALAGTVEAGIGYFGTGIIAEKLKGMAIELKNESKSN